MVFKLTNFSDPPFLFIETFLTPPPIYKGKTLFPPPSHLPTPTPPHKWPLPYLIWQHFYMNMDVTPEQMEHINMHIITVC
jgi:hypothetical protein